MFKFIKGVPKSTYVGVALLLCAGAMIQSANATIILEGSDAIGYHSNSVAAATAYRDQVWTAIGGADSRSIAVLGGSVSAGVIGSGTHAISRFADIAAAGALNNYVALYFLAGGGCCAEDDSLVDTAAEKTAVTNYLSAGGTIMIENYTGGAAWDFAIGTSGNGNAHVAGFAGGLTGAGCSDGETVTAAGTLNGFTQPGPLSCWTHQAYDQSGFFAALGFTTSYFNAGPDYPAGFSSLLANGKTVTGDRGSVPEPTSLALLGIGLAGLAMRRKRLN